MRNKLIQRGQEALALRGEPPARGLADDEPALVGAEPACNGRQRRRPTEGKLELFSGRFRVRVELEQERLVDSHTPIVRGGPDGRGLM